MGNTPALSIKNLTKYYKGKIEPAVCDISLDVQQGEIFGLLGPNGAGKTTTISMIASLLKPNGGEIYIEGLSIHTKLNQIKSKIGVVFQDIALYEKLTAFENLFYFGSLYDIPTKDLKKNIDVLLDRLGLLKNRNDKVGSFSGGMKRRINLLAGVLHNPDLLILDEPVVGIDVHSKNAIREYLLELNEGGTTIIYTSHVMEDVQKLCNRIAIIDYGKILYSATPNEMLNEHVDCESLEDVFLKLTGKNLRD